MSTPYGTLFEDLQTVLFDWLFATINPGLSEEDSSAIPIIRAFDDAIRPQSLYIEYDFLTGLNKIGIVDELQFSTPDDSFKLKGEREFTVTVTAIGQEAQEYVTLIQQKMDSPNICDILRAKGLSVRNSETITDQTVFQETNFEVRAVLDVRFGLALELLDAVERIEKVELVNNLPGGKTVVVNE